MTGKRQRNEIRLVPDPVIEAYKCDVDRTLLRENLKLSVDERFRKLMALRRFAEELRISMRPRQNWWWKSMDRNTRMWIMPQETRSVMKISGLRDCPCFDSVTYR